ncbi:protein DCL homolog, chloroplastic [Nymphaea colorata]|nr:protein DCL homolog, chloroplastic [Nymphaea colorata]
MASFCSSAPHFHSLILPWSATSKPYPFSSLRIPGFVPTSSAIFLTLPLKTHPSRALKTNDETNDPALLRKPSIASVDAKSLVNKGSFLGIANPGDDERIEEGSEGCRSGGDSRWVNWEDRILEDTVPLVGFVRMVLHSGKYQSGDRLSMEHEKKIIERLLPYHPEVEKKIGCGIDFITIGFHPDFENSRCLFIVRKDGLAVDFSFWKCIKGFIRKKYPLYADSFIIRHFRHRRRSD